MIDNYYDLFLGYLNKINFYHNFDKSIKTYFTDDKFIITLLTEEPFVCNFELTLSTRNKIEYYSNNILMLQNYNMQDQIFLQIFLQKLSYHYMVHRKPIKRGI